MGVGCRVPGVGSVKENFRLEPAAGHPTPDTSRIVTLIAATLATACAVVQEPPGGPPDFDPPVLESVTPDSGAIVPDLDDPLVFRFDEVISERSGGGLETLVRLSPRAEGLDVDWKRSAIAVRPEGGWRPNVVYQITLLPGVMDLRSNRTTEGRMVVFTTGGAIPDTRLEGVTLDWDGGRVARSALIEAILLPDSLVYTGTSDSVGAYVLTALPRGTYLVNAVVDGNNNREREPREPFDSVTIALDSTAEHDFWAFVHDTLGPQVRQITLVDSLAARVQFSQKLQPGAPDSGAVSLFALPDTTPLPLAAVWSVAEFDSVRAAEQEAAAAAAEAEAEEAEEAEGVDTVAAPVEAAPARAAPGPPGRAAAPTDSAQAADSTRAQRLLATRRPLEDTWVIRPVQPFQPGGRYLVETRAANVSGAIADSRSVLIIPAPSDST